MVKKPTNKMTVRPSEATEASAASPLATPSTPENRWQFMPTPKYSPAWWQENVPDGTFADSVNFEPGALNPDSWVITWTFSPMEACRLPGYWPNAYPTATDALLWLRFQVLPQIAANTRESTLVAKLINLIDLASPGTDAAALLNKLKPTLVREFPGTLETPGIEITSICTVHKWLRTQGTPAEFRKCYGSDEIKCEHGRWTMPQLWWDRLVYDLSNNEMEYLSVPTGVPKQPWPPKDWE